MQARLFGLGLGGNTISTPDCIRRAAVFLRNDPEVAEPRFSRVYRTPPWGEVEGGFFLNCAVAGGWLGSDSGLLATARKIEAACGSPVIKMGGARSIDVDVLFLHGGRSVPELVLPHPRMHLRAFVLVPLADVFQGPIPGLGLSALEMLAQIPDESHITLCEEVSFD